MLTKFAKRMRKERNDEDEDDNGGDNDENINPNDYELVERVDNIK